MLTLEDHCRRLENMYQTAPINHIYKPAMRVSEREAEVSLTVIKDFHHAANAMHGSVYFKCLDDAAFFAANSIIQDVFVLTVTFSVVLLRPVVDGRIIAIGKLVHATKNLLVAESELHDERGKMLARGSGTFMRSTSALTPEIGYAP